MALKTSKYIWHDGRLVPWGEATVHVLSHALHYGSSVFEGIRVYDTPKGAVGFRLTDHMRRLFQSAKIYRIKIAHSLDALVAACHEVVVENALLKGAYIRPIAFRGYGEMGVAGNIEQPAVCSVAAWEWGSYLGEGALENGADVCVSSWQRVAPIRYRRSRRPAAIIFRARSSRSKHGVWGLPRGLRSTPRATSAKARARTFSSCRTA
jgi:branched-chain amino acid aminotransferase